MAFAANLLALLLVLLLSWAAMTWMSGRFHGGGAQTRELDGVGDLGVPLNEDEPCTKCGGVGAHPSRGRVVPCEACFGTGVLR